MIGLDNHFRSVNLDKEPNKAYFSTSVNNVMRLSVERKIWIRIIIHEVQARNSLQLFTRKSEKVQEYLKEIFQSVI